MNKKITLGLWVINFFVDIKYIYIMLCDIDGRRIRNEVHRGGGG